MRKLFIGIFGDFHRKLAVNLACILVILLPFYFALAKLFARRINAFGCTDECFNLVAGFFITKGKIIYQDFFFNHQPFPAYISAFIQTVTDPINITDLFLKHHQFVILFGFCFSVLLIFRFGLVSLGFIFIFELLKPYFFGDKFYGESLTVYPLVYLAGLLWYQLKKIRLKSIDILLATLFTWFILFTREPMTLAALFAYTAILSFNAEKKWSYRGVLLFMFLCIGTLILLPTNEYVFNIYTVNKDNALGSELTSGGLGLYLRAFFYPILPFFTGPVSLMRTFLVGLCVVFLSTAFLLLRKYKKYRFALILFIFLGLSNPRPELPGNLFYVMFHSLNYFGVLIFVTVLMLKSLWPIYRKATVTLAGVLILSFFLSLYSSQSYLRDKNDPHTDFMINLGHYLQWGEVIKALSNSGDSLFVDGWEELVYWQAGLLNKYPYTWYISSMPKYEKYSEARIKMFKEHPPEFYIGTCDTDYAPFYKLPSESINKYMRLNEAGKPSCIYILNSKTSNITTDQWQKAKDWLFEPQY